MSLKKRALCLLLMCALVLGVQPVSARGADIDLDEYLYNYSGELTEGQLNIVRRARQLLEIEWTPLHDVTQWGYEGVFHAGETYTGVPYGQPVRAAYIGYDASLSEFIAATEDSSSLFYTSYSEYGKIAPYYSIDCSGFVSYSWGLQPRCHTRSLPEVSYLIDDQSLNGLEVGDCLNDVYSHAALVGGVVRDDDGEVIYVEILEQTPVIAQRTVFGEGGDYSIDYFQRYYFGGGYRIYRYFERDSVEYEHDCTVPIDDDYCEYCSGGAPTAYTETYDGYCTVTLDSSSGMDIYYTTDGSEPDEYSEYYYSPIDIYETTELKVVATDGDSYSRVLNYTVRIERAEAPKLNVDAGISDGHSIAVGSIVSLSSDTYGADIYYTTDGSEPNEYSSKYTAPFIVNDSMTVKACAMKRGYQRSISSTFELVAGYFSNFDDVAGGIWYNAAVNFVSSKGLFNGTSPRLFSPDTGMTRGMFVTALGRLAGVPQDVSGRIGLILGDDVNIRSGPDIYHPIEGQADCMDTAEILGETDGWYEVSVNGVWGYIRADYINAYDYYFTDLDMNAYYAPYVQWVYLSGVSRGTGDGSFSAEECITRQDMAVLLYNYAEAYDMDLSWNGSWDSFSDDWLISDFTRDAVYALRRAGVINGMDDGSFAPYGGATRAQVAQIFMNFIRAI